ARYVEDIAYIEEIIAGKDINDGSTYDLEVPRYYENLTTDSSREFKIGIPKEFYEGLSGDIKNAADKLIENVKELGFEVKEVSIPSTKYGLGVYYILVPSEISSNRARYDGVRFGKKASDNYERNMIESRSKYLEDEVKRRIMIGTYSLSKGYADQFYKQASKVRTKLKREFENVFNEVDLLITPVSPSTAFKLGEKSNDPVQMYLVDIYTVTANLVGIPSLSIPVGKDSENMPIGMQIMGNKWQESKIFELARVLKINN